MGSPKPYQSKLMIIYSCAVICGSILHITIVCYTGEGGNDLLGNMKQIGNQKLQKGNAALVSPLTCKSLC